MRTQTYNEAVVETGDLLPVPGFSGCSWRTDAIKSDQYRASFIDVPRILEDWMTEHGGLAGKRVLDFGCGECISGLSIALQHPSSEVFGIEILRRIEDCLPLAQREIELDRLPENLHLQLISPGDVPFEGEKFDFIYSWSVFEHIDQRIIASILQQIRSALLPSGRLLIQIDPLFYSSSGSHLLPWVPDPWGHLRIQTDVYREKIRAAASNVFEFESLIYALEGLNRLTHPSLRRFLEDAGFVIERSYIDYDDAKIPADLEEIYSREVLLARCLVFLCKVKD